MQDDKPDISSEVMHVNQARDDEPEQKPRDEEYIQEAEQLLKLHRSDIVLPPSLFLAILNFYVLFVAALGAFGVLAYYSNHITTLEIVFVALGRCSSCRLARFGMHGPASERSPQKRPQLAKLS